MQIGVKPMPFERLGALPPEQARQMFRDIVQAPDGGAGRRPGAIAYRGESRPFERVQEQGTTPRALLGDLVGMNIAQDWHAYTLPAVRTKWYARRTSSDNCLHTVNSVADAPSLSVGFPLIEDENCCTIPDYHHVELLPAKAPGLALCRIGGVTGIAGIVLERRYQGGGSWLTEAQVGSVPDLLAEAHFARDQAAALEVE